MLPGITRDTIITLARDLGFAVREQDLPREMLYVADEVFFVGTAVEVTPIRSVDKIAVGEGRRGPVTTALQTGVLRLRRGPDAGSAPLADTGGGCPDKSEGGHGRLRSAQRRLGHSRSGPGGQIHRFGA